jgi:hypothetical protein
MPIENISPDQSHLTALLDKALQEPIVLKSAAVGDFVLLPLDDEVIDLLLERHPGLIAECREIRSRMKRDAYRTHDQLLAELREKPDDKQ